MSLALLLFILWDVVGLRVIIIAGHDSISAEKLSPLSSEEGETTGDLTPESSNFPPASADNGESASKPSASGDSGESASKPSASGDNGEGVSKPSASGDNGEDVSKPSASADNGESASKPSASGDNGEDAPESSDSSKSRDAPDNLPLSGHIICIDPGHCVTPLIGKGLTAPVSPLSDAQKPLYVSGTEGKHLTEEKLNLIVGLKLRDALKELGADVLMTREISEISVSNVERSKIANNAAADVNIHIHADGSDNKKAHGVSVLIPDGDLLGTPSIKQESARLGELMVNAVAESTGAKNRGTVPRDDMTSFNFSQVPTVLIEMGFMTNPEEDALLETDAYQNKIVKGMVTSLLQWYGVDF